MEGREFHGSHLDNMVQNSGSLLHGKGGCGLSLCMRGSIVKRFYKKYKHFQAVAMELIRKGVHARRERIKNEQIRTGAERVPLDFEGFFPKNSFRIQVKDDGCPRPQGEFRAGLVSETERCEGWLSAVRQRAIIQNGHEERDLWNKNWRTKVCLKGLPRIIGWWC
jgi:hypothetical protein